MQQLVFEGFSAAGGLKTVKTSGEHGRFFEDVEQTDDAPAAQDLRFQAWEMLGFGLCWQRRERDPAFPAFRADSHILRFRAHEALQRSERAGHLRFQRRDKLVSRKRLVEIGVIGGPMLFKITRQVVIGIAKVGSACHPHLFGPYPLSQGLQDAQLVGQSVDPHLSRAILLRHDVFPGGRNHTIERRAALERIPD